MQEERKDLDIFRPASTSRAIDYASCPKLRFDRSHLETPRRGPGAYAYNPHLKMLCNDVDFLTKKAKAGDTAIYIGGSIGAYILLLAKMFPSVQFVMYDHNVSNSVKKASDTGLMPPNLQHRAEVFSEKVAAQLLLQDSLQSSKLLLMSDLRNITRNAWGNEGQAAVTDDNVINDLHLQENWVQLLRPRSAQLKFKLPYHGPAQYSYLKGDVNAQLFAKQTTSEIRLTVDAPLDEMQEYPRYMYDKQQHEDSMYHHNYVVRMQHTEASNRIRISFDQNAAHHIFAEWKEKAIADASLSGVADEDERRVWASQRIRDLDQAFDRSLGLRMSEQLRDDVLLSCSSNSSPGQGLLTQSDMAMPGVIDSLVDKKTRNRMWRKNIGKKRGRGGGDASSSAVQLGAKAFSSRRGRKPQEAAEAKEEGEI